VIEQADETWLSEFKSKITTDWDFTAIHVNKNNLDGVKNDIVIYFPFFLSPKQLNKVLEPLYVLQKTTLGNRIRLRQRFVTTTTRNKKTYNRLTLIIPRQKRFRTMHKPRRDKQLHQHYRALLRIE